MEEVIKYFERLEARIAALEEALQTKESRIATLEAEVEILKNRPEKEPETVVRETEADNEPETPAPKKEMEQYSETESVAEPVLEKTEKEEKEEEVSPKAALYGKAVEDIRQAISLGDRFLYQRELFGQNAELMQRTLNELNGLHSFDEAMAYIGKRFQWDTESNTYQQFLVTLHRRFG